MSNAGNSSEYLDGSAFSRSGARGPSRRQNILLRLIRGRKDLVDDILEGKDVVSLAFTLALVSVVLLAVYGGSMGLFSDPLQAVYSAIKLPLLFLGTLAICYFPLYFLTVLIGAELGILRTLTLGLSALAMGSLFLAGLTPVSLLFTLSDVSREFLTLFHAVGVGAACVVMAVYLGRVFSDVSEETPLYPAHVRRVLSCWVILIALVGVQVAFLLLPFVGDTDRETEFLRSETSGVSPYRQLILNIKKVLDHQPWP